MNALNFGPGIILMLAVLMFFEVTVMVAGILTLAYPSGPRAVTKGVFRAIPFFVLFVGGAYTIYEILRVTFFN